MDANTHTQQSGKGKTQDIITLAISPDGVYVASATANYALELWDTFMGKLFEHTQRTYWKSELNYFSKNGSQLISGSAEILSVYGQQSRVYVSASEWPC